jgi:hypothetical protein
MTLRPTTNTLRYFGEKIDENILVPYPAREISSHANLAGYGFRPILARG